MEEIIEVKFHADIDDSFIKKSMEHLKFKIEFAQDQKTNKNDAIFGTKSISFSEVEKLCCMEKHIREIKGITKVRYIHCDKKTVQSKTKKPRYQQPLAIVIYSIIGFLFALIGVAISGCMNTETMIMVIIIAVIGYAATEFVKYYKEIYEKDKL